MCRHVNTRQRTFRAAYLAHGDLAKAYAEAGYRGHVSGAYKLLQQPFMQDTQDAIVRGEAMGDAIIKERVAEAVVKRTVQNPELAALATREGIDAWLMGVVAGTISIEHEEAYFDQEGQRVTDTVRRTADMKERLKAVELIQKQRGYQAPVKVDHEVSGNVNHTHRTVYVHVDNGRGPALPVTGTVTGRDAVDACGGCGGVYPRGSAHVCKS
jgi:hypothetical protein